MHRLLALVETRTRDVAGHGRALRRVEPAVGPPAQAVDDRVRVFQAEPLKVDLRVAVGHVVVVPVGIEEQVRRVEHPDASAAAQRRRGDVQPVHERLVPVEDAVAVGVFVNRDLVSAANMMRRRRRHLVIDGAPDAVVAEHLEPGRERVLQILHDPEPAALVEAQAHRLADDRLGQDQIDLRGRREPERPPGPARG